MIRPLALLAAAALAALALPALADAPEAQATPRAAAREAGPAAKPLALGAEAPMPVLKMTSVDGASVSLADVKGAKGTLVVFTCNHCPFVKAWQTRMVRIGKNAPAKGVGVVFVNSNDPSIVPGDSLEAMKELAKGKGYTFPYVVDSGSKLARAFGATRTPEAFLFDAGGKLVYHGAVDDNGEDAEKVSARYLQDAIDALAAGQPVPVSETKAIGCGIKFTPEA